VSDLLSSAVTRRGALALAMGTALATAVYPVYAQQLEGPLVVQTAGGNTEQVYLGAVYSPFSAETGVEVIPVPLVSEEAMARMIAEEPAPSIDMYQFTGGQEHRAKTLSLTQPVGDLGGANVPEQFRDPDGEWVGVGAVANGILYNTKYITTPPTSIKDFLKPEYADKVGLAAFTNVKGIDFMVMLAKAYGGSESDTDVAMEKIGELLSGGAKVFSVASQLRTMFAQEEIWIAYYDVANALNSMDQGLPIGFAAPQEGMSAQLITNAIAKNSTKGDTARAAIAMALRPESQLALSNALGWFPVNGDVSLPAEVADRLGLDNVSLDSLVVLDRELMDERKAEWLDQFNALASR
jgi:putative spermidine/putrescine transport system substrate-binding protein